MHKGATLPAREIAERLLARTGICLQYNDFETFADCFLLPQTVGGVSGERELRTRTDIRDVFDGVRNHFIINGVSYVERYVEEARFVTSDVITSTHITILHKRDGTKMNPYPAHSVLKWANGEWLISDSQYAVVENPKHAELFSENHNPLIDPLYGPTFNMLLQNIAQAFVKDDFELLKGSVRLPFFLDGRHGPQLLDTEDALRADFEKYQTELSSFGMTDCQRVMQTVQPINSRMIVGTYYTRVLSEHRLVLPSYNSTMTIEQDSKGEWRATSVQNAADSWPESTRNSLSVDRVPPFNVDTIISPDLAQGTSQGDTNV